MNGDGASVSAAYRWWLLGLAWLVGINLRTSLIGLAPVLSLLQRDWGLSFAGAGLLFSLPLGVIGAVSVAGGWLCDRWGAKWAVTVSLALVALGAGLRASAHAYAALLAWTAVLGAGVGLTQPSLLKVVKEWFADRPGLATGVTSSGIMTGAFLGVILTPAMARLAGWRGSFWIWGGIALLTLLIWIGCARERKTGEPVEAGRPVGTFRVDRPLALAALLFLLQSVSFYCIDVWLPLVYQANGWSLAASARPLAAFELAMLLSGMTAPAASDRVGLRRPFLLLSSAGFALAFAGFVRAPLLVPLAFGALLGGTYGTYFGLSMVLPVDLARPENVGRASGFVFALGYLGSILGPILSGVLHDWTGSVLAGGLPALLAAIGFFLLSLALPETGPRRQRYHV